MSSYGEGLYKNKAGEIVDVEERSEADLAAKRWELRDPSTGEQLSPHPTPETKNLRSASIYAITKKNQEEQVMVFGRAHQLPVVALRYFNTYGPRQSLNNPYTGVAAIFLNRIKLGQPLLIFEDGNQQRDFVSVHRDACKVLDEWLKERQDASPALFMTRTGRKLSRREAYGIVLRVAAQANAHLPEEEKIDIAPHVLRHTFLRKFAEAKGVQYAREASGHQSDRYIWRYVKPDHQTLVDAIDELE